MPDGADNGDTHATTDPQGETVAASPGVQAPVYPNDDNPFADDPSIDASSEPVAAEVVELPPAFHAIADQLPRQTKAKLKECDVTTAQVVLEHEGGGQLEPMAMAKVLGRNFALNCARRLGSGGWITVTVLEPKKPAWYIAFEYDLPANAAEANPLEQQQRMLNAYLAEFKRLADEVKLEAALGGGGGKRDSLADTLRELKDLGLIGGQQQQTGGQFAELALALKSLNEISTQTQASALKQLLDSREMTEKLGMGRVEKSTAAELKEILEIPVVKDVAGAAGQAVTQRLLHPKDKSNTPEMTGQPGPVDDNPFAESA